MCSLEKADNAPTLSPTSPRQPDLPLICSRRRWPCLVAPTVFTNISTGLDPKSICQSHVVALNPLESTRPSCLP
jgi:hypothetical protein